MFVEKKKDGTVLLTGGRLDPLDVWPIGSIYLSVALVNPTDFFGGTWARFGYGRVLVGLNEADPMFDSLEEEGGSGSHILTPSNLPAHVHGMPPHNHSIPGHSHNVSTRPNLGGPGIAEGGGISANSVSTGGSGGDTTGDSGGTTGEGPGTGAPIPIIQPYITVLMWKRTA